jgi:hypothetical protein
VREISVKGRNLSEGVPRSFTLNSNEILEALQEPLQGIVQAVKAALEQTPPELGADVAERGIVLTGGGALLRDIDKLLMEETGLPVIVADDPLTCVARAVARCSSCSTSTALRVLVDMPSATFGWAARIPCPSAIAWWREPRAEGGEPAPARPLQQMASLEAENARLRALMESPARLANRVQVAEILAVDLDPYRHRIALNRGEQAGVYPGQALLDADGIVGQVIRVNPLGAEAILISDPSHATPVELNRNGLRTVALGVGDVTRMDLPFLPNSADIRVGDLLVSSGLGDAFPAATRSPA